MLTKCTGACRSTLGGGGGFPTSYTAILHSFQLRQSCISDWKNVHGTTTLCRIPHLFVKRAGDLANSQHVIVIASMMLCSILEHIII